MNQELMTPARRLDFAQALEQQLIKASREQHWPEIWKVVQEFGVLVQNLKATAATPAQEAAITPHARAAVKAWVENHGEEPALSVFHRAMDQLQVILLKVNAPATFEVSDKSALYGAPHPKATSPSLKDPGRVEGPGPTSTVTVPAIGKEGEEPVIPDRYRPTMPRPYIKNAGPEPVLLMDGGGRLYKFEVGEGKNLTPPIWARGIGGKTELRINEADLVAPPMPAQYRYGKLEGVRDISAVYYHLVPQKAGGLWGRMSVCGSRLDQKTIVHDEPRREIICMTCLKRGGIVPEGAAVDA